MNRILKDESGITALETAIILIAFVVVAAVFAFTILQAGTFSTERGREAIYGGIEQVSASMEVVGSIKAYTSDDDDKVDTLKFELQLVSGGTGVDMGSVIYSYNDGEHYVNSLSACTSDWLPSDTAGPPMLSADEIVEITCELEAADQITLGPSTQFQLEVKPPTGAVIPIVRTTPAEITGTMVLNY